MESLSGGCHCGAVTVTLPATAFGVVACHCEDCQRLHGNYFAMFAAPAGEVRIEGAEHLVVYRSGPKAERTFCGRCGSRFAKRADGSDRLLLSAGLFGKHTGARLRKHVWAESKPDWYDLPPVEAP
jgi:hypothetical protein